MQIPGLTLALDRLAAPLPIWRGSVDADAWQVAARAVATSGGRLVALWGSDRGWQEGGGLSVCAAYALADGLVW
ncbi:MAG: Ni,Fe-hydrogenase III large subunit, partial [Caldimonas sp.]